MKYPEKNFFQRYGVDVSAFDDDFVDTHDAKTPLNVEFDTVELPVSKSDTTVTNSDIPSVAEKNQ
jgi:hypothetical protein